MNNDESHLGKWISIIYRFGQSYLSKQLEPYNIGSGQHRILLTLDRNGGISQEELSDQLKIDKGCIAKSLKKLEDEGYIEKLVDFNDKRAYKVFLTQKGWNVIPVIRDAISKWEEFLISDQPKAKQQEIEEILYKMAKKAFDVKVGDKENGN
ncbi:MAG: MarR family transcriptional regulator [Clostridiales bacterium]|nr:MarR family transcriptional regulator [Clostridiales bacterium]